MSMTLSEFLSLEFGVERVDSIRLGLGPRDGVAFPQGQSAYFHLVLAGCVTTCIEGQTVSLEAGDFALMLYGSPHTLSGGGLKRARTTYTVDHWTSADEPKVVDLSTDSTGAARVLSGQVRLARTPRSAPVYRALPLLLHYRRTADDHTDGTVLLARLAQIERGCHGPGAALFVQSVVQLHVVQTLRQVHDEISESFPVHLGSLDMTRMAALLRKIREHPEKRWTVASLAQEMGWSRSSFAAKFQSYAGLAPIHFVTRMRLIAAGRLLKHNPDLPVWQVARRVGYETQSSFTRAFKAHFGLTPRDYGSHAVTEADSNSGLNTQRPAPSIQAATICQ